MREILRALLVDDNPDDRALVIRELHRVFAHLEAEHVVDQKTFVRSLEGPPFDLVITDYKLGWSDGLAVLRTVKSLWPDCPVIMFTGTGSEEVAVEAMKAGLDDYVLKSPLHYARLPSVAKLVLKVAEQRDQMHEVEARYSVLFSSVPVGLYRASAEGKILDANPALAEMLGYPNPANLRGVDLRELYLDASAYEIWKRAIEGSGVVHKHEARLRTFGGLECWVENSARSIRESEGGQIVYEGSLESTTARKRAEDERERLILELQDALAKVRTLSGLLPICAACKKIRDDRGYWNQIEEFIQSHSDAEFTHSFCPDCMRSLYPEAFEEAGTAEH